MNKSRTCVCRTFYISTSTVSTRQSASQQAFYRFLILVLMKSLPVLFQLNKKSNTPLLMSDDNLAVFSASLKCLAAILWGTKYFSLLREF